MLRFGQKWWLAGSLALMLTGCQRTAILDTGEVSPPPEATPQQKQLTKSLEAWNTLKAENGDHYLYEVSAGSVFGPSYDAALTVREGKIVQRDLTITEVDNAGNVTTTQSWSETGAALGSHEEGAELITIDKRYSRCRDHVLSQNPTTNDIYLEFQDNGVLRNCSYVPKGVADDGGGEVIFDLEFLND